MSVSTTVNYRGREGYILKGWEYHSKLPRDRERYILKGCAYHSTLQREREVHIRWL